MKLHLCNGKTKKIRVGEALCGLGVQSVELDFEDFSLMSRDEKYYKEWFFMLLSQRMVKRVKQLDASVWNQKE